MSGELLLNSRKEQERRPNQSGPVSHQLGPGYLSSLNWEKQSKCLPPSSSHQSPSCHPPVCRPLFLPLLSFYERAWTCSTNRAGISSPAPCSPINEQLPFFPPRGVNRGTHLVLESSHGAHPAGTMGPSSWRSSKKDGSSPYSE